MTTDNYIASLFSSKKDKNIELLRGKRSTVEKKKISLRSLDYP